MDGIVGKTYQTYNYLPPHQEIDISLSCHKLSENDNFVSKYPSSVADILKLRFCDHVTPISSRPRFWTRARNPVGPRPGSRMTCYYLWKYDTTKREPLPIICHAPAVIRLWRFALGAVLEIPTGPPVRGRQLWRTGNFLLIFLQFYVYNLRFKAWGPRTFLTEFQTLIGGLANDCRWLCTKTTLRSTGHCHLWSFVTPLTPRGYGTWLKETVPGNCSRSSPRVKQHLPPRDHMTTHKPGTPAHLLKFVIGLATLVRSAQTRAFGPRNSARYFGLSRLQSGVPKLAMYRCRRSAV